MDDFQVRTLQTYAVQLHNLGVRHPGRETMVNLQAQRRRRHVTIDNVGRVDEIHINGRHLRGARHVLNRAQVRGDGQAMRANDRHSTGRAQNYR